MFYEFHDCRLWTKDDMGKYMKEKNSLNKNINNVWLVYFFISSDIMKKKTKGGSK